MGEEVGDTARWQRIEILLDRLLELPAGPQRELLLDQLQDGEAADVVEELRRLAAALDGHSGDLLEEPLAVAFPDLVANLPDLSQARTEPAACSGCGQALTAGSRFCPACGAAAGTTAGSSARTSSPSSGADESQGRFFPGAVLAGRYRVVSFIGRGGMGEVYRADDLRLGEPVALKFLPQALERNTSWRRRLLDEVRLGRGVTHPNVCRVHDIGEVDGRYFLSMEYVDGEDLASLLRRIGRLPREKATALGCEICRGLGAAHRVGVLHRDLKPANILVDGRGHAKITDFGLAQSVDSEMSESGGTTAYMAPEQLAGEPASKRSDLFALGLVLYELFTGERAFRAASKEELQSLYDGTTPRSPSTLVGGLDPTAGSIIERCLERDPAMRPASVHEVEAALPGGDPLAAVVAAGETPSPELVAGAGSDELLPRMITWAFAAWLTLGLGLLVTLMWRGVAPMAVPLPYPPAVLEIKAQELLATLGLHDPEAYEASGFRMPVKLVPVDGRLEAGGLAPTYRFWYRQSQSPLTSVRRTLFASRERSADETARDVSVLLTPDGRLQRLRATAPLAAGSETAALQDWWDPLLAAAEIAPETLRVVEPSAVSADVAERKAWVTVEGDRIEAAAVGGAPTLFILSASHDSAALSAVTPQFRLPVVVIGLLGAGLLARRSVRLGRGDRLTARRLGIAFGIAVLAGNVLRAPGLLLEGESLVVTVATAAGVGVLLWLIYMAVEPPARKHWPYLFVSWVRLWRGRFDDPLVGRHLLYAALLATTMSLLWQGRSLGGMVTGGPWTLWVGTPAVLNGLSSALAVMLGWAVNQVLLVFVFFVLLVLLRLVLRSNRRAAVAITFVLAGLWTLMSPGMPLLDLVPTLTIVVMFVVMFFRAGVLVNAVGLPLYTYLVEFPLTWRPDDWFFDRSLLALGLVAGVGLWGAWAASGGRLAAASRRPRSESSV